MEQHIISSEMIKPSSPTPIHLKTHKLSALDQFAPHHYFPIILLYSDTSKNTINTTSDHLKISLSETLTHYYPFAGRLKDDFSIDCDDSGVMFLEARIGSEMSEILKPPEADVLERLLPFKPHEILCRAQVNLAVQVNYFGCSGMAISVCFWHTIAGATAAANFIATAAANFIKNWARIARGANDIKDVVFDRTTIFPSQGSLIDLSWRHNINRLSSEEAIIVKRFTFEGTKMAALRENIGNIGPCLDRPTRFEAVSALIWDAMIVSAREMDKSILTHFIRISVNLRQRMNPPLPQQSMGKIFHVLMENWPMEKKTIDYNSLAGKLRELVRMIDDKYVRKLHEGGELLSNLRNAIGGVLKTGKYKVFTISSWCRLPTFYEADFGWGKPLWVATAMGYKDVVILLDTHDGEGIEAWVALSKEDMAKFEQDTGILAYASLNPSIL